MDRINLEDAVRLAEEFKEWNYSTESSGPLVEYIYTGTIDNVTLQISYKPLFDSYALIVIENNVRYGWVCGYKSDLDELFDKAKSKSLKTIH